MRGRAPESPARPPQERETARGNAKPFFLPVNTWRMFLLSKLAVAPIAIQPSIGQACCASPVATRIDALMMADQGLERRSTFSMLSVNSNLFARYAASGSPSATVRKATPHLERQLIALSGQTVREERRAGHYAEG